MIYIHKLITFNCLYDILKFCISFASLKDLSTLSNSLAQLNDTTHKKKHNIN